MSAVAVLFARKTSHYKTFAGADVFDAERDARTYAGGAPVIAHPPCRAWGRLRQFAKPRHDERDLALWAVCQVRKWGGVLEHPAGSLLWEAAGLPQPGERDEFGGFTLPVFQSWWGHRAPKATWLYIVGIEPRELPPLPFELGVPPGRIENMGKAEREATPPQFASWLIELASKVRH